MTEARDRGLFPPEPPELLRHIRWRRLPGTATQKRRASRGGARPPYRADSESHGAALAVQADAALEEERAARRMLGVDPARLRVLQLEFLNAAERAYLERLRLQILMENEVREPIDPPLWRVELKFADAEAQRAFAQGDHATQGIVAIEPMRASTGVADPLRLACHFGERADARAFVDDATRAESERFRVERTERSAIRSRYRLVVQFPDDESVGRFQQELDRYRSGRRETGELTAIQRHHLFDSLEQISQVEPEDRRGNRLRTAPVPDGRFFVDVDLWHPGLEHLTQEAIVQFGQVVNRFNGRVTDGPRPVAQTLLLARVELDAQGLEALLAYDHVAYVDLPPRIELPEFSVFAPVNPPAELPALPDDAPLVCIIDSGVVAGHPLLRGVVVDERDFDSGDGTEVDTVGHGTHTAGFVVYGDVQECLSTAKWEPRVRLLSAKVLRRSPLGHAEFADEKRAVTQLQDAINFYAREYGCRIFNLSLGDGERPYLGGRQLDWALALDELARQLDVVIVVSAGNVPSPMVPSPAVSTDFQPRLRERLLEAEHSLIDPATAALALTVGAVARTAIPYEAGRYPNARVPLVGAPPDCPSPFTRTGIVDDTGAGLRRVVKPDLVAYGGNYCLDPLASGWKPNDPHLGEVSLKYDFQANRPLSARSGTSAAAPQVAHCCAMVEAELRRTAGDSRQPSANLIRALVVHAARYPARLADWMRAGHTDGDGEMRLLRVAGYGMTNPQRAAFSAENRVVLVADDIVQEGRFHLYELELPEQFLTVGGRRSIRVTLAYDPPVRGTRREYLSRTLWFRMYRGLTAQTIVAAASGTSGAEGPPVLPKASEVPQSPAYTKLQWSTVQSAVFGGSQQRTFDHRADADSPAIVHILVGCERRFDIGAELEQRYAMVVSLEHSDETVRLYQSVRQRVEQRVRLHWPGG